jgi:ribonucleotide reductase alpha subunit
MKRVQNNEKWSLMSPDDCPGLSDCYGDDFEKLYTKYESEGRFRRQIQARELMDEMITTELETGMPYICFKDNVNRKTNQQNIGVIKSSNLCVSGDTLILTNSGYQRIDGLVGKNVSIWNGYEWSDVTPFKTGSDKKLLHIKFSDGSELKCTDYHVFYIKNNQKNCLKIEARSLRTGHEIIDFKLPDSDIVRQVNVVSVEVITNQVFDTYCFTEPKRHTGIFNGVLTGQCSEIMEVSSPDETACCVLASVALPKFVTTGSTVEFDYDLFDKVVTRVVRGLNNVIDKNRYTTDCAERSNNRHRPLGIGVQGLADLFYMFRTTFGEPLAKKLNTDIFEALYYYAVKASMELAKQFGTYSTFEGSPMSKGLFQFDMWGVTPSGLDGRCNWTQLKADVMQFGVRNSLLIALMPTASTSQLLGFSECIEPYSSNCFARGTVAGNFQVVNRFLMEDLIKLDLWSEEVCNAMIANNGSIQSIDGIPDGIKRLYKTAWEIDAKDLLDLAADRGAYVCQSQSLNLFKELPVDENALIGQRERLRRMYFYAWKIGLKTGQYYLRTRPAKDPIKVTLGVKSEQKRLATQGKLINRPDGSTVICTDSVCIMCE